MDQRNPKEGPQADFMRAIESVEVIGDYSDEALRAEVRKRRAFDVNERIDRNLRLSAQKAGSRKLTKAEKKRQRQQRLRA